MVPFQLLDILELKRRRLQSGCIKSVHFEIPQYLIAIPVLQ